MGGSSAKSDPQKTEEAVDHLQNNNYDKAESDVPFDVERRRVFFLGWCCFVTFLFIFHVLGCLILVGLLEYVRAEGW